MHFFLASQLYLIIMKSKKLFLLTALLAIASSLLAQTKITPKFKHIIYATYGRSVFNRAEAFSIKDLLEIDEAGVAHFKSQYYNGVADTTYQLSNEAIRKLNIIFNGEAKLKTNIVRTQMEEGSHFGGSYDYVSYIAKAGNKDELIVVTPFMKDEFNAAFDRLAKLPKKANKKVKSINDPVLKAQILKCQEAATYLHKIEEPPTQMN